MIRKISLLLLLLLFCSFCACNQQSDDVDTPTSNAGSMQSQPLPTEDTTSASFEYMSAEYRYKDGKFIAPTSPDANILNPVYSIAYNYEHSTSSDFVAELEVELSVRTAKAGILFGTKESGDFHRGYAFTITQSGVSLIQITADKSGKVTENLIVKRAVDPPLAKVPLKLRIERNQDIWRFYYMDDISAELIPWPEIETTSIKIDESEIGIGYIDDGRGASFGNITVMGADKLFDAGLCGKGEQYINPVNTASIADPQVVFWEGKYYCYSTSYSRGFKVFESEDLVSWTDKGVCLEGAWETQKGRFWAPEVVQKDGKFYMVFSNNDLLGIAVSDSPLGPFIPESEPLIKDAIDGHIFFDDDGRVYLYYVSWINQYGIYGCELDASLTSVVEGSQTFLLGPDAPWERHGEPIAEGPALLKHNGTYYLTYSGSHYTSDYYAVGYATADTPLGKYTRYPGSPILSMTEKVHGPGHHSFITTPEGEMFIVYHSHRTLSEFTDRIVSIDRMRFSPSPTGIDKIEIYGPTSIPQNFPK